LLAKERQRTCLRGTDSARAGGSEATASERPRPIFRDRPTDDRLVCHLMVPFATELLL